MALHISGFEIKHSVFIRIINYEHFICTDLNLSMKYIEFIYKLLTIFSKGNQMKQCDYENTLD